MATQRFSSLWYSSLSGVLLLLATPLVGIWPLAPIALVPFFLNFFALRSTRQIISSALLMGVPYALASGESLLRLSGTWWVNGTETFSSLHTLAYMAGILLVIFFAATFYVIPVLIVSKIKKPMIPVPLLLALCFAFVEFIRSSIFLAGYSWGALGYLLIDATHTKHVASLAGVYGLTFIIVLIGAWAALLIVRYTKSEGSVLSRLRGVFFAEQYAHETIALASLLIAVFLFGMYRESRIPEATLGLRVAVIASDITTRESIDESSYHTYRSLLSIALEKDPDIILTPENVFPYFIVDEEGFALAKRQPVYIPNVQALYADLLALSRMHPKTTFAIAVHSEKNGQLFNSILLYRDGRVLSIYHKRRPVPFTEYAPLGLPLPLFEGFAKGNAIQDFHLDTLPLAGYICSEISITPLGARGAKLILSPSNDGVFVSKGIASLHHQIARMRALEAGAYLLRSVKGGVSSIIDPYGNAMTTMSGQNGVLVADIP